MNFWDDLALQEDFRAYAQAESPREAVALVVGGKLRPVANSHPEPENHFRIDPLEVIRATRDGGLQAVLHSHPDGEHHPSEADMRGQNAMAVPWGLVTVQGGQASNIRWWGDAIPRPPLENRVYITGIQDCFGLARDYYIEHFGIYLPNYPRRSEMWVQGESLFEDFVHQHCEQVEKPERHDAVLMRVRTQRVNHCGIYLGDDRMLHHPWVRLSCVQPLSMWSKYVYGFYRLKDLTIEKDLPVRHSGREIRAGTA